jgi:hypothetical protein
VTDRKFEIFNLCVDRVRVFPPAPEEDGASQSRPAETHEA